MDTILALKASGVSSSTMSGGSRFQSLTVLGKKDIFLVSIRQDSIWNALLCVFLERRQGGISLFSLVMDTSSLSILYIIISLASFLLFAKGLHLSLWIYQYQSIMSCYLKRYNFFSMLVMCILSKTRNISNKIYSEHMLCVKVSQE